MSPRDEVDEQTLLQDQMEANGSKAAAQEDVVKYNIEDWLVRGVFGALFCFLVFKFLLAWVVAASAVVCRIFLPYSEGGV